MKAPYLFTSLQLIQLCETITSLKTKIEFIRLLGPRLIDPSSKVSTFLSMFRYNDDKQNVENILRTRQTSLIQSQFIMVDNNDNNGNSNINNNNNNNSNSSSNTNNDSGKDGFNMNNNNNSPVKSTVNNSRKSSSILSRRIVGGRGGGGSSNRNSFGGNSSTITSTDADAASATDADATTTDATDNDYIKDESCNSITSSPLSQPHVSSPHVSPSIVVTATESEEGSRIYDKSINNNNNNNNTSTSISSLDVVDVTLNLNDTSSLLDVHNKDNHHLSLIKEDADQNHNDDIHNDVFLNGDNKHCFHDDDDGYLVGDDNDVLFDSRPLASHCSNRQSLIWANRLSSFMDNHY